MSDPNYMLRIDMRVLCFLARIAPLFDNIKCYRDINEHVDNNTNNYNIDEADFECRQFIDLFD